MSDALMSVSGLDGVLLPDFLIIGAPKAATTSLFRYMQEHPQIFFARVKEPHYFLHHGRRIHWTGPDDDESARNHVVTKEAYEALFDEARPDQRKGEASVHYLDQPQVIPRIQKALGRVDLIVCLRDPTERAYSNYLHMVRFGREELSFEEALDQEQQRLSSGYRPFWGYARQGLYHRHLKPWVDAFGRERLHVVLVEDLERDPDTVLRDVFRFLGVHADVAVDTRARFNITGKPRSSWLHRLLGKKRPLWGVPRLLPKNLRIRLRSRLHQANAAYPAMAAGTRARLHEVYREDILAMEELLGRDLAHWLE